MPIESGFLLCKRNGYWIPDKNSPLLMKKKKNELISDFPVDESDENIEFKLNGLA
jgi:hypothetical protein